MRLILTCLAFLSAFGVGADTYIDSTVCATCHAEIAHRYAQTSMATSVRPIARAAAVETNGSLEHVPSGKRYLLTHLFQSRSTLSGEDNFQQTATHTIGSGKNARSYIHRSASGELSQLPASWYSQEKRWGMSPGYDTPTHPDFSRSIEPGCLFCHTAYPPAGASRPALDTGVDWQRCHGPGNEHVRNPQKNSISRYSGIDVCLQCHLQSTSDPLPHAVLRFDRSVYSYRPGEKLSEYAVHFVRAGEPRNAGFEINSHGYQLLQSPCYVKSAGRLQCITCHDPHGEPSMTAVRTRTPTTCLMCHNAHPEPARADCVECHMPPRRAQDAVHVIMTDHRITRDRPVNATATLAERHEPWSGLLELLRPDELAIPLRPLYLGVAYIQGGANPPLGLELLRTFTDLPDRALVEFVRALENAGENAAAVQALARTSGKLSPPDHIVFGEVLLRANKMTESAQHFRSALPAPKASMGLAFIALKQGRFAEAAEHWRMASESPSLRTEALVNLGNVWLESGDLAGSLRAAVEAVAFEPNSAPANNLLSRVLAAQNKLTEATVRAKRAVTLDPEFAEAHYTLGRLLHQASKRDEAVLEYQKALQLRPELYGAHLSLGIAYVEAGSYSQAVTHFQAALKLRPDLREAEQNLRMVERRLRKNQP